MITIAVGEYYLGISDGEVPDIYGSYLEHAQVVEEFDQSATCENQSKRFVVTVGRRQEWPILIVTQNSVQAGMLPPGILLVPETHLLLIGAGERLLCYRLDVPSRLWEDTADCGFWGWARFGDYILMSAEVELAAWSIQGQKLWSTFVEPPYTFKVERGIVVTEVMGDEQSFPINTGPVSR